LPRVNQVIDMVAHCHEQVEEQLSPHLHLILHGSTTFECFTAANNQSEVVGAQSAITVWCVLVRIAGATEYLYADC
jgi:hypothetical protein